MTSSVTSETMTSTFFNQSCPQDGVLAFILCYELEELPVVEGAGSFNCSNVAGPGQECRAECDGDEQLGSVSWVLIAVLVQLFMGVKDGT